MYWGWLLFLWQDKLPFARRCRARCLAALHVSLQGITYSAMAIFQ